LVEIPKGGDGFGDPGEERITLIYVLDKHTVVL
jgi:hypothetical protein